MAKKLVLSAVGPDQVGLVQKISAFLKGYNANIEDSQMAAFCGEFAIIMLLSGEESDLKTIEKNQSDLAAQTGLHIFLRRPGETRVAEERTLPYRLTASSLDYPGIVYRLTSVLSEMGINIDSMETKTYYAPMSGAPMFRFEALLSIPEQINVPRLRARFQEIGETENFDLEFSVIHTKTR